MNTKILPNLEINYYSYMNHQEKLENKIYKLSYKDLSSLFAISLESVKYHFFLKHVKKFKNAIQNKQLLFSSKTSYSRDLKNGL